MEAVVTTKRTSKAVSNDSNVSSSVEPETRSGLEMLRGRSPLNAVDPGEMRECLNADKWTWMRWQGVTQLRVFDALALHHRLDPDRFGLSQRTQNGFFASVCQQFAGELEGPLFPFFVQFVYLENYVLEGQLPCLEVNQSHPLESLVELHEFARFMRNRPLMQKPPVMTETPVDRTPKWTTAHMTPYTRILFQANSRWRTVAEGGTYVPGDVTTAPDVYAYLRSTGQVSAKLCSAMVTLLRPQDLPKGRRPRPRQT
jgi:hypothetical protein